MCCSTLCSLVCCLSALLSACAVSAAEPQWIWGTADANRAATTGTFQFRKTFDLQSPTFGRIEIACDNRYALRVNNCIVGAGNDWRRMDRYDITDLLVAGSNVIDVRCMNHDDVAGLVARLVVREGEQPARDLSTDATWQVRFVEGGRWRPRTLDGEAWRPAATLGAFGKTASWGSEVKAETEVHVVHRRAQPAARVPFELRDGDRVVFVGNTFIEQAARHGYLEAAFTACYPDRNIVFRNLGWSGDTVFGHARARFEQPADGLLDLEESVFEARPTVIVLGYGSNAAFEGEAGLDEFRRGLMYLLNTFGRTGARMVLLAPPRVEDLGDPWPDPTSHNENVRLYRNAISGIAKQRGAYFVDLFEELSADHDAKPLTHNGMHFTAYGYWKVAEVLRKSLKITPSPWHVVIDAGDQNVKADGTTVSSLQSSERGANFEVTDHVLPIRRPAAQNDKGADTLDGRRVLQIRGLATGRYCLAVDGQPIATASHEDWAKGVRLVAGPEFTQAEQLRHAICEKNRYFFCSWRPQNETYLYLFRKQEQGNNARDVLQFGRLVAAEESAICRLRVPATHRYVLEHADGGDRDR